MTYSQPPERFRDLTLSGWYNGYEDRLNSFYLPTLSLAVRYDRLVGYWRSSSLVVAASAVAELARRQGKMRIIAGAELTDADIDAIRHGKPLEDALAKRLIEAPDEAGDLVADHRYEVLAWMLQNDLLEIRIGVPVDEDGEPMGPAEANRLFHSKFGVLEDEHGDLVVMSGSSNESAKGWIENHESFNVFNSWGPTDTWLQNAYPIVDSFNRHWNEEVPGWKVIDFPDEAKDHLLKRAPLAEGWVPPRDPALTPELEDDGTARDELSRVESSPRESGGTGVAFVTAPIEPWPHQSSIAGRVLATWPRSYLFADEVGLGKTIEAGLVIKELLITGKADRILILVPASVQKQWQEELWEKFCLDVPSYEKGRFYNQNRDELTPPKGVRPWAAFPVVLASSHLARMRNRRSEVIDSGPWDLVLVDEAHHARRRGNKAESANQLLQLLRSMKEASSWKALVLATATPMQMHTHEVYDLLDLFGLPGQWGTNESSFEDYYRQLTEPDLKERNWARLKTLLRDHLAADAVAENQVVLDRINAEMSGPKAMKLKSFHRLQISGETLVDGLTFEEKALVDRWFRANTPVKDRIFRTSREALREYQRQGILPSDATIPIRQVGERFIGMTAPEEQLYNRIEAYINKYYEAYTKSDKKTPLGFIMTVYRRRLTSSFNAVHLSLKRRLAALEGNEGDLTSLLDEDDEANLESLEPDELEGALAQMKDEITELRSFVADLAGAIPNDTKVQVLVDDIRTSFMAGHKTIVVFTQFTDTLSWLRDQLKGTYGNQVACYTGAGGSRWNNETKNWDKLTKEQVKTLFRAGKEVRILLGTDAMSEGLNLQTCDRMINYDMPWNFMRVEQRIGRIDRINGQPTVNITNYFYKDTVEEQVYSGIKEDAEWFEQVVGPAQPVLGQVQDVIAKLAMQSRDVREQQLQHELDEVRSAIDNAKKRPINLETMADLELPEQHGYGSMPAISIEEIEQILTNNPLTRDAFHPYPELDRTFYVEVAENKVPMTFDRTVYDRNPEIGFLSYGHPVFDEILRNGLHDRE